MSMRHQQVLRYVLEVAGVGSIRRAAERLNITSSALNRRIQDLEAEIDTPLFQRWPRGVRLTAAGELFVRYARAQLAEGDRMQSALEDLRGLRRGHVTVACSQALIYDYLPRLIMRFQSRYPLITLATMVADHDVAVAALAKFEADITIAYRPSALPYVQRLASLPQRTMALMRKGHPLASSRTIRFADLAGYPLAMPDRRYGSRQVLDEVVAKRNLRLAIKLESDSFELLRNVVARSDALTLQIEIGAPSPQQVADLVSRPVDPRDVQSGELVLCQLRNRSLPVAAAIFAEWVARDFKELTQAGTQQ